MDPTAPTVETLAQFAAVESLLRLGSGQDPEAFAALYETTAPRVLGLVSRVLGAGVVAHEVVVGVYVAVWVGRERPAPGDSLPWLLDVAHRHAVARLRGRSVPRQRRSGDAPAMLPFPADASWLPMLGAEEREALCQLYLLGHTHWQTDARLGLEPGSTIRTAHTAMLRLVAAMNGRLDRLDAELGEVVPA